MQIKYCKSFSQIEYEMDLRLRTYGRRIASRCLMPKIRRGILVFVSVLSFFTVERVGAIVPSVQQRLEHLSCERVLHTRGAQMALVTVVSPDYDVPTFNLGLAELAGYLKFQHPELQNEGIHFIEPDIELAHTSQIHESVEYIIERLSQIKPQIIGLSVKIGSTENLVKVLERLRELPWAQNSLIVIGNVVSTFSYDRLITQFPEAIYVLGDGELSLEGLYRLVRLGEGHLEEVPNLVYLETGGGVIETLKRTLDYRDQCWLPDFSRLEQSLNKKADVTIRATTGCSAHCTFCSIRELGLNTLPDGRVKHVGWQSFPPERTVKILDYLSKQGVQRVNFADDELGNVDWRFLEQLATQLIANGNRVKFNASMRLDAFWRTQRTNESNESYQRDLERRLQILRKLRQAGLDSLFVGAESGSATQLRRFGKGYTPNVNLESLKRLASEGVGLSVGFIPFDPMVSRAEVLENLAFIQEQIGPDLYVSDLVASPLNVMRVQRGTPYEKLMRKGDLLGELEVNLTFYKSDFEDPRMGFLANEAQRWFREVLAERYPVIQLRRIAYNNPAFGPDVYNRAHDLIRRIHRLDIEMVMAVLQQFPEDTGDRGASTSQQLRSLRQAQVEERREKVLQSLISLKAKRDHIAKQMRYLIDEVYRGTDTIR